jgi:hypothetical protein
LDGQYLQVALPLAVFDGDAAGDRLYVTELTNAFGNCSAVHAKPTRFGTHGTLQQHCGIECDGLEASCFLAKGEPEALGKAPHQRLLSQRKVRIDEDRAFGGGPSGVTKI